MEKKVNKEKLIVTLVKYSEICPDKKVFNWVADGLEDALNIINKTIEEIRDDWMKQGYNKEHINFPGKRYWYKKGKKYFCHQTTCLFHILDYYYEFHISRIEDKTKNFFWDCDE